MERRTISWIDAGGIERQTYLTSSAGATFTFIDLLNISTCDFLNWYEGTVNTGPGGLPTAAAHISVADQAAINLDSVLSLTGRLYIPAPILSLFLGDGQFVDVASAPYILLRAQCLAFLAVPFYTLPVTAFREGWIEYQSPGAHDDLAVGVAFVVDGYTLVWLDAQGRTTTTRIFLQGNLAGIVVQLQQTSNAVISQLWGGTTHVNGGPAPTGGDYPTVRDAAEFVCSDTNGNLTTVVLPGPQRALFEADGVTINPGHPLILALYANILAELVVPSSGLPVTAILGGRLRRNNRPGAR